MSGATCECGCGGTCAAGQGTPGRRGMVAPSRTHQALKRRMLDAIATRPELVSFTTRADDDPAIALIDAWAASLHVLSFYRERFQTEAYIGIATDVGSVRGLAAQVGYAARPAISASTTLTFTLSDFPDAPQKVPIHAGSKVQTVPGPDEAPVLFETSDELEARPSWNAVPAKRWHLLAPAAGTGSIRVSETLIAGRIGDVIGFIHTIGDAPGAATFELARIAAMTTQPLPPQAHITVDLDAPLDVLGAAADTRIAIFSRRGSLFGYNASPFVMLDRLVRQRVLRTPILESDDVAPTRKEWPALKASLRSFKIELPEPEIPGAHDDSIIDLDAVYPEAMVGRHVVLKSPAAEALFRIIAVAEVSRSAFGVSAKVSRLTLDRPVGAFDNAVRSTAVFIETEALHLAPVPYETQQPVANGFSIELAAATDLPPGRLVVVQGVSDGMVTAEAAIVESTGELGGTPVVTFTRALARHYAPGDLVVLGNAVAATHGETRTPTAAMRPAGSGLPIGEILGSGDARKRNQGFALRQTGLTFVQAPNVAGYAPALDVRVDDALRPREPMLYDLPDTSPAYALETTPDGRSVVRFAGRLRTADNNVSAVYRVGGGAAGNLAPGRLTLPMTMVLGFSGVTNPLPAEGGVDPEPIEEARLNAPVRIVSLGRIVSLADYAAFARAYGGVAKALASPLWVGQREVVHVTVAGPKGAAIAPGSTLYANLASAMAAASPPGRPFRLLAAQQVHARATLALESGPAFPRADVEAAVKAALAEACAPDRRSFAHPLAKSTLLAVVQAVPGVVAARVDHLSSDTEPADTEILGARGARIVGTAAAGAEYLTLAAADVTVTGFAP
ncbi:baseplate J/gp47 family protein [Ancylobacter sp. 6x-1]|uniref:Baseplate J/gp47 family protein n=1 Tax=Ancylobacter crimeensis TaxID=2579147 RepID=A0ABT0D5X8_9HYPH|nr:baseplate J/gp47 family protein [Ancylobacter crimeensis]MCK0195349.1 baseplate J/gp47 family protein [Ancylobacter crimeensis]